MREGEVEEEGLVLQGAVVRVGGPWPGGQQNLLEKDWTLGKVVMKEEEQGVREVNEMHQESQDQ